jgi:hypothetical protein
MLVECLEGQASRIGGCGTTISRSGLEDYLRLVLKKMLNTSQLILIHPTRMVPVRQHRGRHEG